MDRRFTGPYPNGVSPSFVDDPILAGTFDVLDPNQPLGHISTRYIRHTAGRGPIIG